uniref:Uncharacterized protein n=1 Tax=Chromera velia CCMP2878 TaxID=1169474 RepID=A0A0G4EZF9_9ALVE|eukprot:Cvel_14392.t1-p1 / transcript=Cvel_14392.t1 / gene=Cvel_14392 / organism=Chromera_velia_CCMP2878 / gene_product=hypothetical protein / transcript_product=hypothetical protein / location=Cvel_scaffold1021:37712-38248(+) / protein_length=179 / sequence_SO=supercontig / SO=protein_coding / is_pseudo=false
MGIDQIASLPHWAAKPLKPGDDLYYRTKHLKYNTPFQNFWRMIMGSLKNYEVNLIQYFTKHAFNWKNCIAHHKAFDVSDEDFQGIDAITLVSIFMQVVEALQSVANTVKQANEKGIGRIWRVVTTILGHDHATGFSPIEFLRKAAYGELRVHFDTNQERLDIKDRKTQTHSYRADDCLY